MHQDDDSRCGGNSGVGREKPVLAKPSPEPNVRSRRGALAASFVVTSLVGVLFISGCWGKDFPSLACQRCVGFVAIMAAAHVVGYRLWQRQQWQTSACVLLLVVGTCFLLLIKGHLCAKSMVFLSCWTTSLVIQVRTPMLPTRNGLHRIGSTSVILLHIILIAWAVGMFFTRLAFPVKATEIIGHRGASKDAPENTVASLRLGFAQGVDGCELDFRSTRDHRLIVIHDDTTKRVAGVDKKVSEQTFDELRALEVGQWGKWKGKGFAEKLPTLDEALATIPEGRRLFLHCYCAENDIIEVQDAFLRSGKKPEQVVLIAFTLEPCKKFKAVLPRCKAYWLYVYGPKVPSLDELIQKAKAAGVDGLNLDRRFPIDKAFVEKVHNAGLELHVWTVDDPSEALRLIAAGVDSITTNRPGWLRSQVKLSLDN